MEQAKLLNFKKSLSESNNVLIVLPEYINTDTIVSASTLYNFISHTLKKNTSIASTSSIPERFKQLISTVGVNDSKVLKEVLPLKYIVSIPNSEKDIEVVLNRKEEGIELVMVPHNTELDLSKVVMSTVGNKFDTFIFINTIDSSDAGSVYEKNSNVFKKDLSFIVNSNYDSKLGTSLYSNENSTASETVFQILEMFGANLNQALKDILFEGIVSGTDGLHKVSSSNALETILKVSSQKDFAEKMKNLFYGYSNEGLELRKKMFANIKQNNNLIYSELSEEDLSSLGIKGTQLEGFDFLPFSIVDNTETFYILSYKNNDENRILIQTWDLMGIYTKLKDLGYKVSRSNNLVALSTKTDLNNILKLLTPNTENAPVHNSQSFNNTNNQTEKQVSEEQPLFENNANKNGEKVSAPVNTSTHDSPFKQLTGKEVKSDNPFQQA